MGRLGPNRALTFPRAVGRGKGEISVPVRGYECK